MKNKAVKLFAMLFLLFSTNVNAQPSVDYEKFGRIATVVIKEDYPGQAVKDYLYQGRKKYLKIK